MKSRETVMALAVNRLVAGSNPARGAKLFSNLASQLRSVRTRWVTA
jgi:hypothetical protein